MDNYKRRDFIKLSALGFAGIALHLHAISSFAVEANAHNKRWDANTSLNWDALLEKLSQLAKTQHELLWDKNQYTEQVKRLLLQCDFPQFDNVKKEIKSYENKRADWFESASLHYELDFQVSLFQFEKGEYIPHHDHPDMTGVINVVSGDILAKNYTIQEQLTSNSMVDPNDEQSMNNKKCLLREVGNESIKAGHVSILTAEEGNIHSIMPNEFTQLIDVFTPAYKHDTNANWYKLNEDQFYNGMQNVFEAEYSNKRL